MTDLLSFDAHDLLAGYRNRTISPKEVATTVLDAIEAHQPALNAFVWIDRETALAKAGESEARWVKGEPLGALDGLPMTVKDNVAQEGYSMLRGSRTIR